MFERFAELGSVRQVWLWFRREGSCHFCASNLLPEIAWVARTNTRIHHVFTNPMHDE
ncbi:MAG: hypothetical protein ACT4OM_07955 [Actinomycetota bacterium]